MTIRAGEPGGEGFAPGTVVTRTKRALHYVLHGLDECRAEFEREWGKQEWLAPEGDSDADAGD